MFLYFLNQGERLSFVKLAQYFAFLNNNFAQKQKEEMSTFAKEMNLLQSEVRSLAYSKPIKDYR